jgi:hypothetical protein
MVYEADSYSSVETVYGGISFKGFLVIYNEVL